MGDHRGLKELIRRRTATRHQGTSERFRSKRESRKSGRKQCISAWEITMCHPFWKGKVLIQFHSTPDYGERMIIQHLFTPTTHFIHHPFITFDETGWRILSALWSTRAAAGNVRAGTPGRGKGRKGMDSIKTWLVIANSHVTVGFYVSFTHPNFFLRYAILRTLCWFNSFFFLLFIYFLFLPSFLL